VPQETEILQIKPNIYGVGIDLKARRVRNIDRPPLGFDIFLILGVSLPTLLPLSVKADLSRFSLIRVLFKKGNLPSL